MSPHGLFRTGEKDKSGFCCPKFLAQGIQWHKAGLLASLYDEFRLSVWTAWSLGNWIMRFLGMELRLRVAKIPERISRNGFRDTMCHWHASADAH